MVVPSVNECICKPSVICEKLGLGLDIVRLRDSRRELTVMLPTPRLPSCKIESYLTLGIARKHVGGIPCGELRASTCTPFREE